MGTFEQLEAERIRAQQATQQVYDLEVHNGASGIRRGLMVQYMVKAIVCLVIAAITYPWAMRFLIQYINFLERTQI